MKHFPRQEYSFPLNGSGATISKSAKDVDPIVMMTLQANCRRIMLLILRMHFQRETGYLGERTYKLRHEHLVSGQVLQ